MTTMTDEQQSLQNMQQLAVSNDKERITQAVKIAEECGMFDGGHHKQWVIDQMLRVLLGDNYEVWLEEMNSDPDYTPWDVGIAP